MLQFTGNFTVYERRFLKLDLKYDFYMSQDMSSVVDFYFYFIFSASSMQE